MSDTPKKQTFLHGAALLAVATAIVKVIGALYKIPLNAIIGEQGFSYFSTAYDIYTVLLLVSTAGLPVAMSRMISEASSLGNYVQVRRVYKTSRAIFLTLGIAGTLAMMLFSRQLAVFEKQPDAWIAIACLGPSSILVCLLSTYRGFFQGQGNMIPTSVSNVLESAFKLIIGIGAAVILLKTTQSIPMAAGGAILGVTLGCLVAGAYLFRAFHKSYRTLPQQGEAIGTYGSIAKKLLAIAVPITIGSAGLQFLFIFETRLYMGQLLNLGNTQAQVDTMKGIYNMTQTIYNMPCAFITPITISIIPAITAQLTLKEHHAARATEESAARITGLIALPCAVGLFLLSEPITALLGGYTGEKLALASSLMSVLGIGMFFHSVVQLTNAIMQSHGHATIPVVHILLAGLLKLAASYFLSGIPSIGIVGVPVANALCNLCVFVLNLIAMARVIPQRPAISRNVLRALLPSLVMGGAAFGVWKLLKLFLDSRVLLCGVPILCGVVVYVIMAVLCKSITREDCLLLPKGEKIARLLRL